MIVLVVGPLVMQYPEKLKPVMDEWIQDDNLWVRRTAIIHQLSFKQNTDADMLFRYNFYSFPKYEV